MPNFDEIDQARQLLGLGDAATLKEIRQHFRELAREYHPDKCKDDDKPQCEEMMKRLNQAYELVLRYCREYKYAFREEDVDRTYPYEEYLRKYRRNWFDGW
jgi:preprotein translocase subunit Sec63